MTQPFTYEKHGRYRFFLPLPVLVALLVSKLIGHRSTPDTMKSALILLLAAGASASSLGLTKDRARPAMTTLVAAKPKAPVVPFYAQADNQFKVTVLAAVVGSAYLGTMPGMVAAVVAALTDATAVATTFGTYMLADTLSNFIQHPTQKMDYGFINKFIGREVD